MAGHIRGFLFVDFNALPPGQHNPLLFSLFAITRTGKQSVLVFFVLSGFLVGGKTIQKLREGTFNLQSYAVDRVVRIYLPLISALLLVIATTIIINKENDYRVLFGNFLSLQGVVVPPASPLFWSLSYEVWFYVIMGAVACFFSTTSSRQRIGAFAVLLISFAVFTRLQLLYLVIWMIGALSYLFVPVKKNKLLFLLTVLICLGMLVPLQMTTTSKFVTSSWQNYLNGDLLELIFSSAVALLIVQVITFVPKTRIAKGLDRLGTRLASFSYTLYLVHYPLLGLLMHYGFPKSNKIDLLSLTWYFLVIAGCMAVSYALYWLFEKRTAAVKKHINNLLSSPRRKTVPAR